MPEPISQHPQIHQGCLPRAHPLPLRATPDGLRVSADHPLSSSRSPEMLWSCPQAGGNTWNHTWSFAHGARPAAACKGCLKGHPKHTHPTRSGTELCLPPHQGPSLPGVALRPCSQPAAFGHAMGRVTKALAEPCSERSHRWMKKCTPWVGEALHVLRHVAPVPPFLPCSLPWGSHPPKPLACTSHCSGAWRDPLLGKLEPPPHPGAPQHAS